MSPHSNQPGWRRWPSGSAADAEPKVASARGLSTRTSSWRQGTRAPMGTGAQQGPARGQVGQQAPQSGKTAIAPVKGVPQSSTVLQCSQQGPHKADTAKPQVQDTSHRTAGAPQVPHCAARQPGERRRPLPPTLSAAHPGGPAREALSAMPAALAARCGCIRAPASAGHLNLQPANCISALQLY